MSQVEVGAKLSVDTGNASVSINDLQKNLKEAKTALNEAKIGSQEYTEAQKKVKEATEQLNKVQGESSGAFSVLKDKIFATVPGLQAAETGVTSFGTALKALAMNPIVLILTAIVTALGFLYEAFTSTAAGAKQVAQILDGLKAIAQELYNRLMTFGSAIIKLFSGDLKGAINDAKASVTGLSTAIGKAYDDAARITKRLQELKKEQREDDIDRARRERDLALLREKLNDDSVPLKERLAAAKQLRDEQKKNAEDDLRRTTEISNLKIQRLKMERDGEKKNADEIAELQKNIYRTQTENALEGVRTNKVIRNLERQGHQEAQQEIEERKKKEKELADLRKQAEEEHKKIIDDALKAIQAAEDKANEDNRKYQFEKLKKFYSEQADIVLKAGLSTRAIWEAYEKERSKLEDKYRKEDLEKQKEKDDKRIAKEIEYLNLHKNSLIAQIEADRDASEKRIALAKAEEQAKVDSYKAIAQASAALSEILGKDTVAGKALAIATAVMNTYVGVTEALKQKSTLPSPFDVVAKVANVATVVATGMKAVRSIMSVNVPGQGGAGGSVPNMSAAAPVVPSAQQSPTAVLSQDSLNQINGSVTRAFVVESDVTNNQQRISRINRAARLS